MENKKNIFARIGSFFIPNSGDTQKRKIVKIISILAVVVLIVGIVATILIINKYATAGKITGKDMDLLVSTPPVVAPIPSEDEPSVPGRPADTFVDGILTELSEMYKVNEDLIGLINIPDTKLKYPVTKGTDNVYYLDHTLEKESNPFGVPFMDYRAVVVDGYESDNLTMYGHSAVDGTFFAAVKEYKDVEFYKKHPLVEFDSIYGKGTYKVIGLFMEDVRRANTKRFSYHDFVTSTKEDRSDVMDNINEVLKRSYFNTTVDVNKDDKLLMLSTCDTEVNDKDYRVVLVARKVRDGEKLDVDTAGAAINEDMVMPDGWVKKKGKTNPYE